jgi:hypothetical protein
MTKKLDMEAAREELQGAFPKLHIEATGDGVLSMGVDPSLGTVCDFCSSLGKLPVVTAFEARDQASGIGFIGDQGIYTDESIGNWAACQPCADLIRAKDKVGLVQRAVTVDAGQREQFMPEDAVRAAFTFAHGVFWKATTGREVSLDTLPKRDVIMRHE